MFEPEPASEHDPLPMRVICDLSPGAVIDRAAAVSGQALPVDVALPAAGAPLRTLAVARVALELLLTQVERVTVCRSCSGTPREVRCAGEVGVLEARVEWQTHLARQRVAASLS